MGGNIGFTAVAEHVKAEEKILQEMRDAEAQRSQRINEAAVRGEVLDIPPIDPEAAQAIRITSSPGLEVPKNEITPRSRNK